MKDLKVDLCLFLAGHNLESYTPLFLETLYKNCDVSNLHIHVVEKGTFVGENNGTLKFPKDLKPENFVPTGDNIHNYLLKKKEKSPIPFTIYTMHDLTKFYRTSTPNTGFDLTSDHGNTLNWAIENCGTNKFVIFCHSDIVFKDDIISQLIDRVHDLTGVLGVYNQCYIVNRDAYHKVGIKFNNVSGFRAIPTLHQNFDCEIKHGSDPRCSEGLNVYGQKIYGWDMGELMELMMIARHWDCDISSTHELRSYVDHMGAGHGYLNSREVVEGQKRRINIWLEKYGVQKL